MNYLLEAKADPNAADKDGATPLHYAARNRSPDVTQRLLDAGADPNTARDREGWTPIDVAPAPDSTPTVTVLRAARAQQQGPVHKEPLGGRRPGKTAEEYTNEFAAKLTQQIEDGHRAVAKELEARRKPDP